MCSRCLRALLFVVAALRLFAGERVLRVCADPNNLPFSNQEKQGLENDLATLIAHDLGARLEYVWWSERKSFLKTSLNENRCDVVLGVPSAVNSVLVTQPYYRSTYVFVSRADRRLDITSLTDERLSNLKIGIHVVGDDYAPPALALAHRGISSNLVGYSLFGEYGQPNPPARIIDAVSRGDVDVAIVWGPFAGYFARRQNTALSVRPVSPSMYFAVPFTYDISAAVRGNDRALRDEIDGVLSRHCVDIQALLNKYGVPRAPEWNPVCDFPQHSQSALSH